MPTTRAICSFSVGFDHIDLAAARARGIVVTNTPEVLSDATAEIAMLLMLGAARRAYELAQDQYKAGLVDFSNVLDAQRSLLSFQDQLAESDGTVTANLIRLYKALGGGWSP